MPSSPAKLPGSVGPELKELYPLPPPPPLLERPPPLPLAPPLPPRPLICPMQGADVLGKVATIQSRRKVVRKLQTSKKVSFRGSAVTEHDEHIRGGGSKLTGKPHEMRRAIVNSRHTTDLKPAMQHCTARTSKQLYLPKPHRTSALTLDEPIFNFKCSCFIQQLRRNPCVPRICSVDNYSCRRLLVQTSSLQWRYSWTV